MLADAAATRCLGAALAVLGGGFSVHLYGELGTGKTTLVRGLLGALGHTGPVRSPTYTLIESYRIGALSVHHFDLYRLERPEELEYLGFRDYPAADALCLVEWPRCAVALYGRAELEVRLEHDGAARTARVEARGSRRSRLLSDLKKPLKLVS